MTTAQTIRILDNHSINWIRTGTDRLLVEEVSCKGGKWFSEMIPCPKTFNALKIWLGY